MAFTRKSHKYKRLWGSSIGRRKGQFSAVSIRLDASKKDVPAGVWTTMMVNRVNFPRWSFTLAKWDSLSFASPYLRSERRRGPKSFPGSRTGPVERGQELLGRTPRKQVRVVLHPQATSPEGDGEMSGGNSSAFVERMV